MPDLLDLIEQAWNERIKPMLDRDPDELQRRLARRRAGMMRRPPRAWCLAVRASDQRINPATAACVPEVVAYPTNALRGQLAGRVLHDRHEVTLTAKLLRTICRPVVVRGVDARTVGKQLGVSPENLRHAIRRRVFRVRHILGLHGRSGNPVPVLTSDQLLDPSRQLFEQADPLWGTTWRYVADHVPDDLEQTLTRVPVWWRARRWTRAFGYDANEHFSGWRWLCPGCGKTKKTLFYPLRPMCGLKLLDEAARGRRRDENDADARPGPIQSFACKECHNVLYFTRVSSKTWNHLIAHLSDGMIYGKEVPRPNWYVPQRKRAYRPLPNRAPSHRRELILRDILAGLSYSQIARKQCVSKSVVCVHGMMLCRQHRVKGPAGLRAKFARVDEPASASGSAGGSVAPHPRRAIEPALR